MSEGNECEKEAVKRRNGERQEEDVESRDVHGV